MKTCKSRRSTEKSSCKKRKRRRRRSDVTISEKKWSVRRSDWKKHSWRSDVEKGVTTEEVSTLEKAKETVMDGRKTVVKVDAAAASGPGPGPASAAAADSAAAPAVAAAVAAAAASAAAARSVRTAQGCAAAAAAASCAVSAADGWRWLCPLLVQAAKMNDARGGRCV